MPGPIIAIVVPCYNTSGACADVIRRAGPYGDVILAVDDGSTDDTPEHLRASRCRVLRLTPNQGKGAALGAGFRALLNSGAGPRPDFVLTIDGDGQHEPGDIPRLVDGARSSGADLVLGMRQPAEMPRKSRIGSHFSRLLFLIGTATFVADTQSGFRLYSATLLDSLIDRVSWEGYETETELLGRAIDLGFQVTVVPVTTIYLDGNRASQFSPWQDSWRIAAVFAPAIRWTVGMAWLDFALFAGFTTAGAMSPAAANVASRAVAVLCQAALRRNYLSRTAGLMRRTGAPSYAFAFVGHLVVTTLLVAGLVRLGLHPILAKGLAQLAGYLGTFAVVDRVLLRRAFNSQSL